MSAVVKKTITIGTAADTAAVEKLNQTLRQLFKTAEGSQAEVAKAAAELKSNFAAMQGQLKIAEQQLRANGVTGKEFAQATLQVRSAMVDAKTGVDAFAMSAKTQGTTVRELQSVYRATKDELGHFRTALDQVNTASTGLETKQESLIGSLGKLAVGIFTVQKAWQLLTSSLNKGFEFDADLSRLAMSSPSGFDSGRERINDLAYGATRGSMFDPSQFLPVVEHFRASGFNIDELTQDNMRPIVEAATATLQDLDPASDVMAEVMTQFGLTLDDTEMMANSMVVAFKQSGMTMKEMQTAARDAGSAAAAAGTSWQDYTAVLSQLKTVGVTGERIGTFQRRFFSAISAPSAPQLRALDRRDIDIYQRPENLPEGSADRAVAQETKDAKEEILRMADAQDKANAQVQSYSVLAKSAAQDLNHLKKAQEVFSDQLKETTEALKTARASLDDVRDSMKLLSQPKLAGMAAFDDEIQRLENATKREELQVLRNADATDTFGVSLKQASKEASSLRARLEELRTAELAGEKAYNDRAFAIQQEMKRFELEKLRLAPHQLFEQNALSRRIAGLQREFSIVNLEKDLAFDPQRKEIEDVARGIDLQSGKRQGPYTSGDVLDKIDTLGPDVVRTERARDALKKQEEKATETLDALRRDTQIKRLEKEVTFADDLITIQQRLRDVLEKTGLQEGERTAGDILAALPTLQEQYISLDTTITDLTTTHDAQKAVVDAYAGSVAEATATAELYRTALSEARDSAGHYGKMLTELTRQFEDMDKVFVTQSEIIRQMGENGFNAADAFEFMGNRSGAMMLSILGPNNERADQLKAVADSIDDLTIKTKAYNDIIGTPAFQKEQATAAARTAQLRVGTAATGIVGTAIQGTKQFFSDIGTLGEYIGEKSDLRRFSMGGIVPGHGYQDTVPALLTPGEEVLPATHPRHRANGGGTTIVNIHNPVVRSEQDLDAIQQRVSRALANELRRVRAGLPA